MIVTLKRATSFLTPATLAATALALSASLAGACGGGGDSNTTGASSSNATSSSGGQGGDGGGGSAPVGFAPEGCAFSIAPRMEYKDFQVAPSDVGATPNIRRVRLGLGGSV